MKADHYDGFADSYAAENASSLLNTYYDKPAMLEHARRRLGDDVPLHVADLAQPLPFADEFELAGERAVLTFWHRPLHAMFDAFAAARFRVLSEPAPSPETPPELLPPRIASGERTAFLCFIYFALEAD